MNQFKSIIIGELKASDIIDTTKYIGVANYQRCIRIGGKHNDLEDIGKDNYHHTFFEMLGNWSFGVYEKEKTCKLALDLLVNVYKLDVRRLYFTYFGGNKSLNLEADEETKNVWLKLGISSKNILPFGMKENFWEMDLTGPCGPCTEIHYDRLTKDLSDAREVEKARRLVNAGHESVLEVWNLVFMQYNRINHSKFFRLPMFVVDTGMGLERLSCLLNNLNSNYETDLFEPLFKCINEHVLEHSSKKFSPEQIDYRVCDLTSNPYSYAYRTISDHVRSITFAISDGLMPSRNGLGGFLKFLILKSLNLAKETFEIKEKQAELLCKLVPIVIGSLKDSYPELTDKSQLIQQVLIETDLKHKKKLFKADETIDRYFKKTNNLKFLNGKQLWALFKGDGSGEEIPIEYIKSKCNARDVAMDLEEFNRILEKENEKAIRNTQKQLESVDKVRFLQLAAKLKQNNLSTTDTSFVYSFDFKENLHVTRFRSGKKNT